MLSWIQALAVQRNRSDRSFDDIAVDLDAAVVKEAGQPFPARQGVATVSTC